ncbi:phage tail protein [Enterococcus entomosocium]|uniref:Phage tail protein n=1 Tax=Enterococcus entomosocium TaxID=3034352 RepID=A0ABV3ME24_9ENTE|nr:phage tail protein [Enterococcus casseliflavus]MDB1709499.1 phage tail protein [Enterococcus casseliflavus]MDB1717506.1 phage tail protein [Enterococcus casseliflavus]
MERPLIAILDNKDQLLCVTDEYEGGNLHTYLLGTAAFFRCSILQKSAMAPFFKVGNKISFIYKNTAYHFDITDMVKNEKYVTVQADSLTLELRNEDASEYKATKAMTFEEYLKVFLFVGDNPLVMGINEVSDKKLQLEWEGSEDDLLARLFSLATRFNAEIEFITQLNQHWGLSQIVLNVYKANDDKNQGVGNNRQDVLLEWGNNVETIEVKDNIDNLKTAIKPIGTDGLTIAGIEIDERDTEGNQLFYSPKASPIIYAVQARNIFMAKMNGEGYIKKNWSYETNNQNTLAGQALAQLKKLSQVEVTVTIKSYEYLGIGDTVRALNTEYQPALNLSVRVSEQDIYFDEPNRNQTKFTNAQILQSEVDTTLLARVQALIEANKVFTYEIITSDGVTFKNGFGSTTLTARVRDGIKDVTDTFSLKWYKDGTLFSNTKTVTINAADIEEKAVFRFEVADDSGNVRGGAEVTVTNIDDGKKGEPGETFYPHHGYLMADGTLVNQVPNENLLNARLVYPSSNNATAYPISNTTMVEDGKQFNRTMRANPTSQPGIFSIFTAIDITAFAAKLAGKRVGLSVMVRGSSPVNMMLMARYRITGGESSIFPGEANERVDVRTYWTQVKFVVESFPANIDLLRFNPLSIINPVPDLSKFYLDMRDWKVEILEPGQEPSYYTTPPNVDYENAYPKYEGFYSDTYQANSTDADKYKPWIPFMGPQGKDGYTPVKNVDYFDGQPGQNGKSAYLWIRYSQNADGSGMTSDPANAKYTGYATTETNVAPTSPSVYKWQQTKGDPGIGIPGEPGPDGKTSYLHIKYSNDGGLTFTGNGGEDGGDYIGQYVDFTEADSTKPSDYTWSLTKGSKGDKGDPAPLISLSGTTQAITVDKDGKITPASSFSVTGTVVNTAISNWTYSLNGGNFGSAVPTGVTRSGNTVTINPVTATFDQLTIKAADATVSDVFTISRIKDGGEGPPGSDAYTVFLTNESYTFAGSTTAALAGSTTTEVIVYKGINKITPTSITVGTKPTGLSSSVSGSIITLTATTALVSKSGTVPITITADGKTFTKQFSYALSLQGATGNTGKGVAAEEISYSISQDGVNPPTSGWSGTRPTPKAGWYMWTRTRFKYTDNTYSAYFYLVAQQGKDAIVISDTAPANPTKGTLWQDSSVVPQIIKVFDGTVWSMWGMPIDNLLATNIISENGVFKRLEGAEIVNTFSYTDSGVTYTGTTTMKDGNVTIARTGSDGSTWTTTMDRVQGFVDTYKVSSSAPARTTQLGQGKLYMVESGVGGYLPAAALNPAPWVNIPLASGFVTIEGATPQYRRIRLIDGSYEVQLRGRVGPSSGNFDLTGRRIGSIPYPASMLELFLCGANSGRSGRMQVELNGDLMVASADSGVTYISLSGIRFVSL